MRQNNLWDPVVLVNLSLWLLFLFFWGNKLAHASHFFDSYFHFNNSSLFIGYNCVDEKELEATLRLCCSVVDDPMSYH